MQHDRRINPEILAQHLERAAKGYEQTANVLNLSAEGERLAAQLHVQAAQCKQWAEAFRNVKAIGFAGDDIELTLN